MSLKDDILAVFTNMDSLFVYNAVVNPPPASNPKIACWYVKKIQDEEVIYELTNDTTLQSGVTYYTRGYQDCNKYLSDELGRVIKLNKEALDFSYRRSSVSDNNYIITSVTLNPLFTLF